MSFFFYNLVLVPLLLCFVVFSLMLDRYLFYFCLFFSFYFFYIALGLWFSYSINFFCGAQGIVLLGGFYFYDVFVCFNLDELSVLFLLLTTLFFPFCFLSFSALGVSNIREFFFLFFILEFLLVLVFSVFDLFCFYVFFESILIPMFLIIGIWGSRFRKVRAAYQFFLYTVFGSIFFFGGLLYIFGVCGSCSLFILNFYPFFFIEEVFLWLLFFFSFAVKIPIYPLHTWLPEAHTEAPTVGSVILAGVLLKLGGFAIVRFLLMFFCQASLYFFPVVCLLSILSILYTSLTTLRQIDLKKIIAYSSVGHMGFVVLGCFCFYYFHGLESGLFLMFSHGLISGALFFSIGILYDRVKTRLLFYFGGFVQIMPVFSFFFFIFMLANMAFPGTSNFLGELFVLISLFNLSKILAVVGSLGTVFCVIYTIWTYNRIFFGNLKGFFFVAIMDVSSLEFFILFCFFFMIFGAGIFSRGLLLLIDSFCLDFLCFVQVYK